MVGGTVQVHFSASVFCFSWPGFCVRKSGSELVVSGPISEVWKGVLEEGTRIEQVEGASVDPSEGSFIELWRTKCSPNGRVNLQFSCPKQAVFSPSFFQNLRSEGDGVFIFETIPISLSESCQLGKVTGKIEKLNGFDIKVFNFTSTDALKASFLSLDKPSMDVQLSEDFVIDSFPSESCAPQWIQQQHDERQDIEMEADLLVGEEIVGITCPITMSRMVNPARGNRCRHVKCFDARGFESINLHKRSKTCPLCKKPVDALVPDLFFKEAIQRAVESGAARLRATVDHTGKPISYHVLSESLSQAALEVDFDNDPEPQQKGHQEQENHQLQDPHKVIQVKLEKQAANSSSIKVDKETREHIAPEYDDSGEITGDENAVELLTKRLNILSVQHAKRVRAKWPVCKIVESLTKRSLKMSSVQVLFPFEKPLPPQLTLMSKMILAMSAGKHALIESPTGTGKTAAILCSTLAWQRANDLDGWSKYGGKPHRIWFATRTHSQTKQVAKALKAMPYRPTMLTLGSRSQLCVERSVVQDGDSSQAKVAQLCRQARRDKEKPCRYFTGLTNPNFANQLYALTKPSPSSVELLKQEGFATPEMDQSLDQGVYDIEDLKDLSSGMGACPFYSSKSLRWSSQLIICPYQYLVHPAFRKATLPEAEEDPCNIFVFDEAHNVESVCRDAGTCSLSVFQAIDIVRDFCVLSSYTNWCDQSGMPVASCASSVMMFFDKICRFFLQWEETFMARRPDVRVKNQELSHYSHTNITKMFNDLSITSAEVVNVQGSLVVLSNAMNESAGVENRPTYLRGVELAITFLDTLSLLFEHNESYHVVVNATLNEQQNKYPTHQWTDFAVSSAPGERTCCRSDMGPMRPKHGEYLVNLNEARDRTPPLWEISMRIMLMDPSIVFRTLEPCARSIILTSGTLFPMDPLELGTSFVEKLHTKLQLKHVIKPEQIYIGALTRNAQGQILNGSYAATSKLGRGVYENNVGEAILAVLRAATPLQGGVLVFVSSFAKVKACMRAWSTSSRGGVAPLIMSLEDLRGPVFFEGGNNAECESIKEEFLASCRNGESPVLVCVYRGRLSEGVDFKDHFCRAVFLVSIPFPSVLDAGVRYKMQWNDAKSKAVRTFPNGSVWYKHQAFRALNQAFGRLIRHAYDYGAVFLVDSRFSPDSHLLNGIAPWARRWISFDDLHGFEHLTIAVANFAKRITDSPPQPSSHASLPPLRSSTSVSTTASGSSSCSSSQITPQKRQRSLSQQFDSDSCAETPTKFPASQDLSGDISFSQGSTI